MIPYEELVEALDRYVAKNGGTPQSARVPSSAASSSFKSPAPSAVSSSSPAPSYAAPAAFAVPPAMSDDEPHAHDVDLPHGGFDEAHDPDLPPLAAQHDDGDSTHVGAMPGGVGAMPPPLAPVADEDHSNEIDIHDVLDDDEI
jgi:hypothetical protein